MTIEILTENAILKKEIAKNNIKVKEVVNMINDLLRDDNLNSSPTVWLMLHKIKLVLTEEDK